MAQLKKQQKKISQQKTLTEGGLEFKAGNRCNDFPNQFRKSPIRASYKASFKGSLRFI